MPEPDLRDRTPPDPIKFPRPYAAPTPHVTAPIEPAPAAHAERVPPPAFASRPPGSPGAARPSRRRPDGPRVSTAQALRAQFREQWQQWRTRAQSSADSARRSLATEINQDVDYVKIRARHYHERQPLQAVGIVAASAFVVGMIFGFWRR